MLGFAWAMQLPAQEVTVTPLAWLEPKAAPQELPVHSGKLSVEFPADLKKTADVGWAMIDLSLSDSGKVTARTVHGTQPVYARAVSPSGRDDRKYKPGRRDGAAVNTRVRQTVVFNPASANPKAADATPRLLDAAVVVDPNWKGNRDQEPNPQRVIWAMVHLDEKGVVTDLSGAEDDLVGLLKTGVQMWRFSPARKGGQPVAADVRVPFIVVPPDDPGGKNQVRPKVISREPPEYPVAMRLSGLRGDVVVDFLINTEGRVEQATVVRSLNPAFDEPALKAVRAWRFEPARVDGRAVNVHLRQPISFSMEDVADGGGDGMEVRHRGDPKQLPENLRYDTPPKIDATLEPKYPYELLKANTRGFAQVSLLVGPDGKVAYSKVVKADRPEFGYALQAAAERFEYLPALKNGQPTTALIGFEQDFKIYNGTIVTVAEQEALALERKHPERILKARDLDRPLKLAVGRPPIFPKSAEETVDHGEATIEFLVDEKGEVRLPRVVSASEPIFGYAAAQAVAGWRFEVPMSKGKPGIARVQVPVSFVRTPAPAPKP